MLVYDVWSFCTYNATIRVAIEST